MSRAIVAAEDAVVRAGGTAAPSAASNSHSVRATRSADVKRKRTGAVDNCEYGTIAYTGLERDLTARDEQLREAFDRG